jgi:hypothetical protein
MASDKKPSIYSDRSSIGSAEELDEYGVWVKGEPQVLSSAGTETEKPGSFPQNFEEEVLNAEESTSFDELDFPQDNAPADFSNLNASGGAVSDTSSSVQDFDVPTVNAIEKYQEGREKNSEGDLSTQLLLKIANELSSIRGELSELKKEFSIVRVPGHEEVKHDQHEHGGFFEEEDDEKISLTGDELDNILQTSDEEDEAIALTGDELDNILNTADFTEESGTNETPENDEFSAEEAITPQEETGAAFDSAAEDIDIDMSQDIDSFTADGGAPETEKSEDMEIESVEFDESFSTETAAAGDGASGIESLDDEFINLNVDDLEIDVSPDMEVEKASPVAEEDAVTESQDSDFDDLMSADLSDDSMAVDLASDGLISDDLSGDLIPDDLASEDLSSDDLMADDLSGDDLSSASIPDDLSSDDLSSDSITDDLSSDDLSGDLMSDGFSSDDLSGDLMSDDLSDDFSDSSLSVENQEEELAETDLPDEIKDSDELEKLREEGVTPLTFAPENSSYLEENGDLDMSSLDLSDAVIDEPELTTDGINDTIIEPSLDEISDTDLNMDIDSLDDFAIDDEEPEAAAEELPDDIPMDIPSTDDNLTGNFAVEEPIEQVIPEGFEAEIEESSVPFDDDLEDEFKTENLESEKEVLDDFSDDLLSETTVEVTDITSDKPEDETVSFKETSDIDDIDNFQDFDVIPDVEEIKETKDIGKEKAVSPVTTKPGVQTSGFSDAGKESAASMDIPSKLKTELRNILSYMDQLLESLPEDKIEEFAKSEYFDSYKKLFKELGLV